MIELLILIFIILLIITNIKSFFRLMRSINFLNSARKYNYSNKYEMHNKIKVIIPAMNEVPNIERSVSHFMKLSDYCEVIYVTTSKESSKATYNCLRKCIKQYNAVNLKVINCPNTFGTMANQINYACDTLESDDIIALYNIDSFPEINTFKYVYNNLYDDIALQQVSFFDDNNKFILKSAQNWQNRWSIIYEMGKYLSNGKMTFKYTIGHGLFIKKNTIEKYGNWSEEEINEDNEFGYRLLINNINILPIPYMEKADFAKSLKIYIKQQSTWVNGPLYAFSYFKKNKKTIKNFLLTLFNFKAFISWCVFPVISIIFLILTAIYNVKLCLVVLLLLIIYISLLNYLVNVVLKKFNYCSSISYSCVISDLLFFIIHSFGCYVTLYKIITRKNNINNKYNTEK